MTLQNITPRKYQEEILESCKNSSCLVILPTGIGKTLIALMLAIEKMKKFPENKILFLAPTRPLAQQHLNYFKKHLPELYATMELFTGKTIAEKREKLWQNADIIFSTPQTIANDIRANRYDLSEVSLLVEDEAHRCIKNYDYTYVAEKYKEQAKHKHVLGLTASPGYEKAKIKQICKNLGIETVEIRTRESEDVKEYLQELKFEIIKVDFPEELENIRKLLRTIFNKKVEELKNRKLLFMPPTKRYLLELQHKIMRAISTGNKNMNLFAGASAAATAIKLSHLLELLETQTLYSTNLYIQDLIKQGQAHQSRAASQLIKKPEFIYADQEIKKLIQNNQEHPKLAKLREIVEQEIKENPKAKIIVFSQYRDSVTRICRELNHVSNIKAKVFVGQAKKSRIGKQGEKEIETGLSQKEQQEILSDFGLGKINCLCATQIAEEGLDIIEVSHVIFYEPIPSEIRTIQRRGRTARLMKGKLIMLITKGTRDESYYWAAFHKEKKMYKAIEGLKEEMEEETDKGKQETLF